MKLFFFVLFLVLSLMYPPYALLPQSEGISLSTKQQQIIDNMMQDNKNPQPSQINDNTLPQNQSIQQLLDNIYGKIHIINPQSYPTVGGYWTVNFTSIGTFDLIVTSINGTSFGAYPDDVTFVSLHDSNANNITSELVSDGIKFSNFHSDGVSSFTVLVNTAGKHHLKFEFGGNVAFANNSAITANPFKIASGTNGGPTLVNNDYFGTSIANIGDLNGDGINDVAVGAYSDDTGGSNRGAVHILFMNVDGTVKSSPSATVLTVPSDCNVIMYMAPRSAPPSTVSSPPVSSEYAPTAISDMPSLLMSPMFATDQPKKSKFVSVGPPFVPDAIFTGAGEDFTVPSTFINNICTAPE